MRPRIRLLLAAVGIGFILLLALSGTDFLSSHNLNSKTRNPSHSDGSVQRQQEANLAAPLRLFPCPPEAAGNTKSSEHTRAWLLRHRFEPPAALVGMSCQAIQVRYG